MMISVENLIYEYPGKRALKDVSFKITKGSVTALVGPNGAGKTTLMRCIAALDEPFSGNVHVSGIDALEHPRDVHKKVGYLSDFFGVYGDLTVRQCLSFIASIHQIPQHAIEKRVNEVAELLGLTGHLQVDAGTLSRGWKQRLGVGQAIIHKPEVLLLDEPASGLDPEARVALSTLFKDLQRQGMTLLVSSHILSELEDYCTEMLLLREGKIIEHAKPEPVEGDMQRHNVVIKLYEDANNHLSAINAISGIEEVKLDGNSINFTYLGDEKALNKLLKSMIDSKLPIYSFATQKKRLQDIYMDYANKGTQDVK